MNVLPGSEVIFTTIRSDSTFVPPVTADRSPPDSRITGADSPVIADSSTLATPSTTSPSPGMTWPASTITKSPSFSSVAATSASATFTAPGVQVPVTLRATVSVLVRRKVSAWALPRPSATASARLANTTVSHSHTVITQANTLGFSIAETVVSTEPTSTTNMTGLFTMTRGSSFLTASGKEVSNCLGSSSPAESRCSVSPAACCASGSTAGFWRVGVDISAALPRAARVPGPGSR